MSGFTHITNNEIKEALMHESRQYLVGNLMLPQKLKFIKDFDIEIGITDYKKHQVEYPHYHKNVTEYQYIISGYTEYLDVENNEIHTYKSGDFYAINSNTTYAQKSKKGTVIVFIKSKSVNDKVEVDLTPEVAMWLEKPLNTIRTDYYYDQDSPKANSIKPAASVAIVNGDKLLMLKRKDNNMWTLPGGTQDFDESLSDCAVREVSEETGLSIEISGVVGIYTDPNIKIEYNDGEVRQEFTVVYYAKINDLAITIDSESTGYQWIDLKNASELKMASSQKKRLEDVIKYRKVKKTNF